MPSDDEERNEEMKKRGLGCLYQRKTSSECRGNESVTSGSEYAPSGSEYDCSPTKASIKKQKKRKRVTAPISRKIVNISFTEESDVEDESYKLHVSKMFSELDKVMAKQMAKQKEQLKDEKKPKKDEGKKRKYEFSESESSEDVDEDEQKKARKRRKKMNLSHEFSTSEANDAAPKKKEIKSSPEKMKHKVKMPESESSEDDDDDAEKKAKKGRKKFNFALDFPKIYLPIVKVNNSHNKRMMCPFCSTPQSNLVPHLLSKHPDEPEVQDIAVLPVKHERRQELIALLRLRGNHAHNVIVEKEKQGMFLPERRMVGPWRFRDFSPCPDCLKWTATHTLWRHFRICLYRKLHPDLQSLPIHDMIVASQIMAGQYSKAASEEMKREVFSIMRNDEVARIAKRDEMIVMMGNATLNRNIGNIAMRRYTTSSVMRLLARLLIEMRALQPEESLQKSLTFYAAIHPSQYENFVTAVFRVCKEEAVDKAQEEEEELERLEKVGAAAACLNLKAPSNAIKLSYDLQKMCRMKVSIAIDDEIKERGEAQRKCTKRFMDKYAANWEVDVKRRARAVLKDRKLGATPKMADPQDIVVFSTFLVETLTNMEKPTTYSEFRQMQYFLEARIITYNRRRPGEVQNMQ